MAMPQSTFLFDVHDCKIWPLLSDDIGAEPTYGAAVDVPGINQFSIEPELISAVLKGDARTLARRARIDSFNFQVGYSLLDLRVMGLLFNAQVTEAATNSDKRTLRMKENNRLPYIAIGMSILDNEVGIGAVNLYGLKCQITGGNIADQSTESFGGRSFSVSAIPTFSTGDMFAIDVCPTAEPLALT